MSDETRRKLSEAHKNKPPEVLAKYKEAARNRPPMSQATKDKISESHANRNQAKNRSHTQLLGLLVQGR